MISERQKYVSGILRNIGFALLTPVASITYQWLVLQKGAYWEHFLHSMLIFLLGVVFLVCGFITLREKK
jgi:hypothetical protein